MKYKIAGVIPARGGSKGVPGKNLRLLGQKPLIAHTIETALQARGLDRIIVSTDDVKISKEAKKWGAEVPFRRPSKLASDVASMMPVVMHAWDWFEKENAKMDAIMLLQPTSPFRTVRLIERAIEKFIQTSCHVLVSLMKTHQHPWWMKKVVDKKVQPFLDDCMAPPVRRQDLPEAYTINGAIFIWSRKAILRRRGIEAGGGTQFSGESVAHIEVGRKEGWEIDTEFDFAVAEMLFANLNDCK